MIELEGKPIRCAGREIAPVTRVDLCARRQVHIGTGAPSGKGWASVRLRPVAIIERDGMTERRIAIPDRTTQLLGGLLLAAFILPFLLAIAVRLARGK